MSKIVLSKKRRKSNGLRGFLITPGHESKCKLKIPRVKIIE
jgi:hypothetical protein